MRAQQTRPKKAEANKRAKVKIQEERKASTNLLALQEHIPTTWEHGPKNRSENRSSAVQSKPDQKKAEANKKKSAKVKIQEERKASTNLLALQEQIPTTWEHGPKNWSENRSSAVQSKPDRKKATASQASEQRSGKNSPERRRQQREEKQTNSEKNTLLLYIKEHHKQHTRRTATPTQRRPQPRPPPPTPPPPPNRHPPPQNDPHKTPTDQRQILA